MLEATMLMISDDPTLIDPVDEVVRAIEGLEVVVVPEVERAHSHVSWDRVALVLIHLKPDAADEEVVRLLRMISGANRAVATLVVVDGRDADRASGLLRLGVADYLTRPLDLARLAHLAEVLTVRARDLARGPSTEAIRGQLARPTVLDFDDPGEEIDPLMGQVRLVAPQDATILLGGETGTGKTRLARRIHDLSRRRGEPFVVVNCASLAAGQAEAELFGHARGLSGSPEGARPGKFAEVGRGTLFLDQIDALPMPVQARLLRVVEDRVFEADGSYEQVPVRARLIAASNLDLETEVEEGRFRSDLYYRLNVIGLRLPPLRDRRGALPGLIAKFIAESSTPPGAVESISAAALAVLEEYDWPGNVRELKNTIERAVALGHRREIQPEDLPEAITRRDLAAIRRAAARPVDFAPQADGGSITLAEIKRDAELARITEALRKHSNNRLRAASELGISRMTLYKKLYKYGLMQHETVGRSNGN